MKSGTSLVIGITGGIACGKSEAGRILEAEGFRVLDCDGLAHGLTGRGTELLRQISDRFGGEMTAADGSLDRVRLGALVFSDPQARAQLNRLVHPAVIAEGKKWIAARRQAAEEAAVLVPLLFEAGWTDGWDAVLCITAPDRQVRERLRGRGLADEEIERRIAAQMPGAEKAARADFTIENEGSLTQLRERLLAEVERIKSRKGTSHE